MNHSTLCSSVEPKKDISPEGLPAKLDGNLGQLGASLKGVGKKAALVTLVIVYTLMYSGCLTDSHIRIGTKNPEAPHHSPNYITTEDNLNDWLNLFRNEKEEEKYDKNY